jgi:AbrB family looped-hinge helix DNA binding protein
MVDRSLTVHLPVVKLESMASYETKLSSQGQVSVPVEVRRKLDVEPGSVLEWVEEGDAIVVRRKKLMSWDELRATLFPNGPPPYYTREQMKEAAQKGAVARYLRSMDSESVVPPGKKRNASG